MATLHKMRLITVHCFAVLCNDNTYGIHVEVIGNFCRSTTQVLEQDVCNSCCWLLFAEEPAT